MVKNSNMNDGKDVVDTYVLLSSDGVEAPDEAKKLGESLFDKLTANGIPLAADGIDFKRFKKLDSKVRAEIIKINNVLHSKYNMSLNPHLDRAIKLSINPQILENEKRQDDLAKYNDSIAKLSEIFAELNATAPEPTSEGSDDAFNYLYLDEQVIGPKLGRLIDEYVQLQLSLTESIMNCKSNFYNQETIKMAQASHDEMKLLADRTDASNKARGLRFLFRNYMNLFSSQRMPDIQSKAISSFEEFKKIVDHRRLFTLCDNSAVTDSQHSLENKPDWRGGADMTGTYPLVLIMFTKYFLRLLRAEGVSEALLNELGTWTQARRTTDDASDFSRDRFVKVDISSVKDDKFLKKYAGFSHVYEFQMDLLNFIRDSKKRAESVLAFDKSDDVTMDNLGKNLLSPDLAVKRWIQLIMNSVFIVMFEDGLGSVDRVGTSMTDYIRMGGGANLLDMSVLIANTNSRFFDDMMDKYSNIFKAGKIKVSYHKKAYQFLKKNWAPIIVPYDGTDSKYLGDAAVPGERCDITLIPQLILPVNPFDPSVEKMEQHRDTNAIYELTPEEDSIVYSPIKLPKAYIDPRNSQVRRGLTVRFQNLLSWMMYVVGSNHRFNAASYEAGNKDEDKLGVLVADPSKEKYKGPHVLWCKHDTFGESIVNKSFTSFWGDMFASCIDRDTRLGLDNGCNHPSVHPIQMRYKKGYDDLHDVDVNVKPFDLLSYHTNSWSLRFASAYMSILLDPIEGTRLGEIDRSWNRFATGVLDNKESVLNGDIWISPVKPCYNNSEGWKELDVPGLFRYSYVGSKDGKGMYIDNKMNKAMNIYVAFDNNSTPHYKCVGLVEGSRLNAATILDGIKANPLKDALNHEVIYNLESEVSLREQVVISIPLSEHNITDVCCGKVIARPTKPFVDFGFKTHGTTNQSIAWSWKDNVTTYSKRISLLSPQALKVPCTSCDSTEVPVASLLYGLVTEGFSAARASLVSWWKEIPTKDVYHITLNEAIQVINYIFSSINEIEPTDAPNLGNYRYSVTGRVKLIAPKANVTQNAGAAQLIDPSVASVTGLAQILKNNTISDSKVTRTLMKLFNQKCLSVMTQSQDCLLRNVIADECIDLSSRIIGVDLRNSLYVSPYKDKPAEEVTYDPAFHAGE